MAAPVFVAPLPAPPVAAVAAAAAAAASPQFHQVVQAPKQLQKRGREVHHAPDEQSSGLINFDQLQGDCMQQSYFSPSSSQGLILCTPNNFSLHVAKIHCRHCLEQ